MAASSTVLILDRDAPEYLDALTGLAAEGVTLLAGTHAADLPEGAGAAEVALGAPDGLAAALPSLPALEWVQSTWAGVTPLLPAARAGLVVTGVKDVFGGQMAEFVLAGLLERAIDLPGRREAQRRGQWLAAPTATLKGRTLGIMGTGSIGAEIASRAAVFGMHTIGFSRSGTLRPPFEAVYDASALHAFLGACDDLVGVLPDTPETHGLLDAAAFAALRPGGMFINVGRGTLVDDMALVAALQRGHLGGALLDVFHVEPLPSDHPFWACPGLTLTAHVAARSWPADISRIFLDNYARYRSGRPLAYRLDPSLGY